MSTRWVETSGDTRPQLCCQRTLQSSRPELRKAAVLGFVPFFQHPSACRVSRLPGASRLPRLWIGGFLALDTRPLCIACDLSSGRWSCMHETCLLILPHRAFHVALHSAVVQPCYGRGDSLSSNLEFMKEVCFDDSSRRASVACWELGESSEQLSITSWRLVV